MGCCELDQYVTPAHEPNVGSKDEDVSEGTERLPAMDELVEEGRLVAEGRGIARQNVA